MKCTTLDTLSPGHSAVVTHLTTAGDIRRRLMDFGLMENTPVRCIQKSPLGSPVAYFVRGAVIAIRREDAEKIVIESL